MGNIVSYSQRGSRSNSRDASPSFLLHRLRQRPFTFFFFSFDAILFFVFHDHNTSHVSRADCPPQEHSPLNATILVSLIKTIQQFSNGRMVPYVRIAPNSLDLINHVLNAGAGGIVLPHVQTAAQADALVRMAKFPPKGDRSYPPMALLGPQTRTKPGQTVYDVWNEHAAVFCQIEDGEGVENIDEIAAVSGGWFPVVCLGFLLFPLFFVALPHLITRKPALNANGESFLAFLPSVIAQVDALMVGAGDLRCSLGLAVGSQDGDEPVFLEALEKIQKAADANNLAVLGFAMTPEILRRRLERGWRALIIHSDGYGIFKSGVEGLGSSLELANSLHLRDGDTVMNGIRQGGRVRGKVDCEDAVQADRQRVS